ncbi:mannose-binding protein c, partial [Plakobranchus ocellatus]
SACRDVEGELVSIASPEENAFIKSLLKDDDATGVWFGLVFTQEDLRFEWDYIGRRSSISFTDWGNDELEISIDLPDDRDESKKLQCASFSKQHDWAWEPKACDESAGMKYVCKRWPIEKVCTSRTCFRLLEEKTMHFAAKYDCEDVGGYVATIRSQEESDAIKDFLDQVSYTHDGWGQPGSGVWLAGSDEDSEGNWYWEIGRQKFAMSYANWRKDEPNNAGRGEHCIVLAHDDWSWVDVDCSSRNFILCEIPDLNPVTG